MINVLHLLLCFFRSLAQKVCYHLMNRFKFCDDQFVLISFICFAGRLFIQLSVNFQASAQDRALLRKLPWLMRLR